MILMIIIINDSLYILHLNFFLYIYYFYILSLILIIIVNHIIIDGYIFILLLVLLLLYLIIIIIYLLLTFSRFKNYSYKDIQTVCKAITLSVIYLKLISILLYLT
jgi:hypothetical protein